MEARDYEELKKKLCRELEQIKGKGSLGMAEIEVIDKLTNSIKNIGKIMDMDEGGHSQARYRYSRDMDRSNTSYNSYDDGMNDGYSKDNSYARRGMHYVRGHYSRGADELTERIEDMMESGNLTITDKSTLQKAMDILRK